MDCWVGFQDQLKDGVVRRPRSHHHDIFFFRLLDGDHGYAAPKVREGIRCGTWPGRGRPNALISHELLQSHQESLAVIGVMASGHMVRTEIVFVFGLAWLIRTEVSDQPNRMGFGEQSGKGAFPWRYPVFISWTLNRGDCGLNGVHHGSFALCCWWGGWTGSFS